MALPMFGTMSSSGSVPASKYFSMSASSLSAMTSTRRSRSLSTTSRPVSGIGISFALPDASNS